MNALFLCLALFQAVPPPPVVVGPRSVQVSGVRIEDANKHAGKVVSLDISGLKAINLSGVTKPRAIVIEGDGLEVQTVSFSPKTCRTTIYDLTITNLPGSKAAVRCESQPPPEEWSSPLPNGDSPEWRSFIDCWFGRGVGYWNVADVEGVPGLSGGKVAAKWWVAPKAPGKWHFGGCFFEASQEHAAYLHWAHAAYFNDCIFGADGGCAIQATWRYGRQGFGETDPLYYGNSGLSPPAAGDFVVTRCEFRDAEIWSREASAVTVVGWPHGGIWVTRSKFSGSRGAIAIWSDTEKGAYSRDARGTYVFISEMWDGLPVLVKPDGTPETHWEGAPLGWPFASVVLTDLEVMAGSNHDREQIMVSGARKALYRDIVVHSPKPQLVIGARWGGPWDDGKWRTRGVCPPPKTWNGSKYVLIE